MHPPRIVVLVTILGVLVTGCTPTPAPEPSPVPSVPTCVPEFGGEPFPCTQAEHDANQKMLARYAEAERVYREYNELSAAEVVARTPIPSSKLTALTTGGYRRDLGDLRRGALELATFEGAMKVVKAEPATLAAGSVGNLSMDMCMDMSEWTVKFNDGSPGPSGFRSDRIVFDDAAGGPLIADIMVGKGESCA